VYDAHGLVLPPPPEVFWLLSTELSVVATLRSTPPPSQAAKPTIATPANSKRYMFMRKLS